VPKLFVVDTLDVPLERASQPKEALLKFSFIMSELDISR